MRDTDLTDLVDEALEAATPARNRVGAWPHRATADAHELAAARAHLRRILEELPAEATVGEVLEALDR